MNRIKKILSENEEQTFQIEMDRMKKIHTENSQKYDIREFQGLASDAGFVAIQVWSDLEGLYSIHYFERPTFQLYETQAFVSNSGMVARAGAQCCCFKTGNKIAVASRTAYGLWLERNIHNAELIQVEGVGNSFDVFSNENLDALAGLRPALIDDVKKIPGAKILEGQFMSVQQAIGTSNKNIKSSIYTIILLHTFIHFLYDIFSTSQFSKSHLFSCN